MVRAMCGIEIKDIKRAVDFNHMLASNETIDLLAMGNIVCWYSHVLSREDCHVLMRAFDFRLRVKG